LAESSVKRFRASLSSFFAWAVRERLIAANPVTGTRVPVGRGAHAAIRPFAEDELESFYLAVSAHDQQLAEVLLIASWTGLRWSELREVRVRDFVRVPMPVLLVSRAAPEGIEAKTTKSGKSRRMPVADRVLSLVEACAHGKGPDDLLFTTKTGHRLHASALKRTVHWSTVAPGRRIHDLRHTAACLWLAKGVDPVTVQAWLGHASIATTNIYLHHLGPSADRAGLDRLNALGGAGGAHEADRAE
jgi:integrase